MSTYSNLKTPYKKYCFLSPGNKKKHFEYTSLVQGIDFLFLKLSKSNTYVKKPKQH